MDDITVKNQPAPPSAAICLVFGAIAVMSCVYLYTLAVSDAETLKPPTPEQSAAAEVKDYLKDNPLQLGPGETFVDGVRRFVTDNSRHQVDDVFKTYRHKLDVVLNKILRRAQGLESPPHLECATRSGAMLEILNAHGIKSRQTYLVSDTQESIKSHTFLEVLNDKSGKWEIQDPDYAVYFIERDTGKRVAAERMLRKPLDKFVPCRAHGDCSWTYAKDLRDFFGVVGYKKGVENPTVIINSSRFDLNKKFDQPEGRLDVREFIQQDWSSRPPKIQIIK